MTPGRTRCAALRIAVTVSAGPRGCRATSLVGAGARPAGRAQELHLPSELRGPEAPRLCVICPDDVQGLSVVLEPALVILPQLLVGDIVGDQRVGEVVLHKRPEPQLLAEGVTQLGVDQHIEALAEVA